MVAPKASPGAPDSGIAASASSRRLRCSSAYDKFEPNVESPLSRITEEFARINRQLVLRQRPSNAIRLAFSRLRLFHQVENALWLKRLPLLVQNNHHAWLKAAHEVLRDHEGRRSASVRRCAPRAQVDERLLDRVFARFIDILGNDDFELYRSHFPVEDRSF